MLKLILVFLLLAVTCGAAVVPETAVLFPSDPQPVSRFGDSVDVHGGTIVVGADYADVEADGDTRGKAYVFEFGPGGWTQTALLTAPDGQDYDQFGFDVAVSGDIIVVTAEEAPVGGNSSQGAAYVFYRNQGGPDAWGFVKKIVASEAVGNIAEFGHSCDIDGDIIVIGAPKAYTAGRVFVYERHAGGTDQWGEVAELTVDVWDSNAEIGKDVGVAGDLVVAGAHRLDRVPGSYGNEGGVYVFRRDGSAWEQTAVLRAAAAPWGGLYGNGVSVDGGMIAVGAYGFSNGGYSWGKAYVYENLSGVPGDWTETLATTASDGGDYHYLGVQCCVAGGSAYFGAPGHADDQGKAYRFARAEGAGAWGEADAYPAADGTGGDGLGSDVRAHGEWVVVGAPGRNGFAGAVYVYPAPATATSADAVPRSALNGLANHPNPFNPSTTVSFALAAAGRVELSVHDGRGRRVAVLLDAHLEAGSHDVVWAPRDLPSGVYLVRAAAAGTTALQRCTLLK